MIIGIGSDLIDITRVAKEIERHESDPLSRPHIFTDVKSARADGAKSEKMVVATYAKRFAAKEACSKGAEHRDPAWAWGGGHIGVMRNLPGGWSGP